MPAETLDEALATMARPSSGDEARVLAGGQSLVPTDAQSAPGRCRGVVESAARGLLRSRETDGHLEAAAAVTRRGLLAITNWPVRCRLARALPPCRPCQRAALSTASPRLARPCRPSSSGDCRCCSRPWLARVVLQLGARRSA